jgi:hypothetical protein
MPYTRKDADQPEAHQRAVALFEHKSPEPASIPDNARADRDTWREQAQRITVRELSRRAW